MKKQYIKKRILKILLIILSLATIYSFVAPKFLENSTAFAVGDLTVDWGIGTGDVGPIFNVTNMAPGDMVSHSVDVTNNASSPRDVAVRGLKTSETGGLSTVLDIVISENGTDLYGGTTGSKTLAQFFTDSSGIDGIPLSTLAQSAFTTYTFKVTFQDSASNDFQATNVVFDLKIGIAIHVPDECKDIQFSGDPIFGTENRDVLHGTNGNDLILAFEGNDIVNASNGDDVLIGGDGNDVIDGSNGDDRINGGEGNDKILASNGNDQIDAGGGNDQVEGSNGNDDIILGSGNDKADGGNGNDIIQGNEGNDTLVGRNGNDILLGGPGTDSANGNLGVDTCNAETEISCEL